MNTVVILVGTAVAIYFGVQELREMVVPRAAKWLFGLAATSTAIGMAAARQVDRSNAGIHPEWIGTARRILSVELFVSITLFVLALVLVFRETKRAEAAGPPQVPESRHRSDR